MMGKPQFPLTKGGFFFLMKMEHRITSLGAAVVEDVLFAVGDRVDAGDLLVRLRPIEEG